MLESIIKAAENFCIHQLQTTPTIAHNEKIDGEVIIAYIDITTATDARYRIYIAAEKEFVQNVAKVFFDEDESDEETLLDMATECTNLIVGSAKVIASENNNDFTISTPHLEKTQKFSYEYDEARTLTCKEKKLFIALKELQEG
jgi:CheY-specific phosphatase CheX